MITLRASGHVIVIQISFTDNNITRTLQEKREHGIAVGGYQGMIPPLTVSDSPDGAL
jgi:hypothetical protein